MSWETSDSAPFGQPDLAISARNLAAAALTADLAGDPASTAATSTGQEAPASPPADPATPIAATNLRYIAKDTPSAFRPSGAASVTGLVLAWEAQPGAPTMADAVANAGDGGSEGAPDSAAGDGASPSAAGSTAAAESPAIVVTATAAGGAGQPAASVSPPETRAAQTASAAAKPARAASADPTTPPAPTKLAVASHASHAPADDAGDEAAGSDVDTPAGAAASGASSGAAAGNGQAGALVGQSGAGAASPPPSVPPDAAALASAHGANITAQLATQLAARSSAPRTAFDFALEPQGLGRVDVSLRIDPQGQLSAVLSFDNPAAAAEAKGRAADLQQALQQAGVNVSQGGLSFTSGGGHGDSSWQSPTPASYAQTSPVAPLAADETAASILPRAAVAKAGGLDITI